MKGYDTQDNSKKYSRNDRSFFHNKFLTNQFILIRPPFLACA